MRSPGIQGVFREPQVLSSHQSHAMSRFRRAALVWASVLCLLSCEQTIEPRPVEIESDGLALRGRLFQTPAGGRRPALLLLPGWPGNPDDVLGMGRELSQLGVNVLMLLPRGMHGSEGTTTYGGVLRDVGAALRWLRDPEVDRRFDLDPEGVFLGGYSWGGGVALAYAASPEASHSPSRPVSDPSADPESHTATDPASRTSTDSAPHPSADPTADPSTDPASYAGTDRGSDPEIRGMISIAGTDHGVFIRQVMEDERMAAEIREVLRSAQAPRGPIRFHPEEALRELLENQDIYGLRENAEELALRSILLLGGLDDESVTLEDHLLPLYRALNAAGAEDVTIEIYQDDHTFQRVRGEMAEDIAAWIRGHLER